MKDREQRQALAARLRSAAAESHRQDTLGIAVRDPAAASSLWLTWLRQQASAGWGKEPHRYSRFSRPTAFGGSAPIET